MVVSRVCLSTALATLAFMVFGLLVKLVSVDNICVTHSSIQLRGTGVDAIKCATSDRSQFLGNSIQGTFDESHIDYVNCDQMVANFNTIQGGSNINVYQEKLGSWNNQFNNNFIDVERVHPHSTRNNQFVIQTGGQSGSLSRATLFSDELDPDEWQVADSRYTQVNNNVITGEWQWAAFGPNGARDNSFGQNFVCRDRTNGVAFRAGGRSSVYASEDGPSGAVRLDNTALTGRDTILCPGMNEGGLGAGSTITGTRTGTLNDVTFDYGATAFDPALTVTTPSPTDPITTPVTPVSVPVNLDDLADAIDDRLPDNPFQAQDGIVVMEVESAPIAGSWVLETLQTGYSGTGYYIWRGPSRYAESAAGDGILRYDFTVPTAGDYAIEVRAMRHLAGRTLTPAHTGASDANNVRSDEENDVWIRVNRGTWTKLYGGGSLPWGEWGWLRRYDIEPAHTNSVETLRAGANSIEIAGRSPRLRIDRIVVAPGERIADARSEDTPSPRQNDPRTIDSPNAAGATGDGTILNLTGSRNPNPFAPQNSCMVRINTNEASVARERFASAAGCGVGTYNPALGHDCDFERGGTYICSVEPIY
jgi:hypothetical protein